MKTYAETKGAEPFDWNKALKGLRTGIRAQNQTELSIRAKSWVTCACGNLCAEIPRWKFEKGRPVDERLADLGADFACHVAACKWSEARQTLAEIEKRSGEILADLRESA